MTLQEINQRAVDARGIAKADAESAREHIRQLFMDIYRSDRAWVVPESPVGADLIAQNQYLPCIEPADEPGLWLRLFSHEDVASDYARRKSGRAVPVDAVTMLQLANWGWLHGAQGFILNDGLEPVYQPFAGFLEGCYKELGDIPDDVMQAYFTAAGLINAVRTQREELYAAVSKRGEVTLIGPEGKERFEKRGHQITPLTVSELVKYTISNSFSYIRVDTPIGKGIFDLSRMLELLEAASLTDSSPDPTGFSVKELYIDPRVSNMVIPEIDDGGDELPEEPSSSSSPPEKKKRKKKEGPGLGDKLKEFVAEQRQKRVERESDKPPEDDKSKTKRMAMLVLVGAALIFVLLVVVMVVFAPSNEDALKRAIESGNYDVVAESYDKSVSASPGRRAEYQSMVIEDISRHLARYAANECTAVELKAILDCYRPIAEMEQAVNEVMAKAAALEYSKRAYEQGLLETSILSRLKIWREVIDGDTSSVAAMNQALAADAETYKQSVYNEISGSTPTATLAGLAILNSYYPGDPDIIQRIKDVQMDMGYEAPPQEDSPIFGEEEGQPVISSMPISIQSLSCQVRDGGVTDLYIEWSNISDRDIACVDFYVIPVDGEGNPLQTLDENAGGYSMYQAREANADDSPFPVGYASTGTRYWQGAWTNPDIADVYIDMALVWFTNGEVYTLMKEDAAAETVVLPEIKEEAGEDIKFTEIFDFSWIGG